MNSQELKATIARKGITNRAVANSLNISEQALYNKISGTNEFKNSEIRKLVEILDLSFDDVNNIFFDNYVNLVHSNTKAK